MMLTSLLRRRRRLVAVLCAVALVTVLAALGGFGRSDRPLRTMAVGERIELGRFAYTVHGARVIDRDENDERFEDPPLRLLVEVTVVNTSDESATLGTEMIGIRAGEEWYSTDAYPQLHPDLPRRLVLPVPADQDALGAIPGSTDVWLGEETHGWTNLLNSGPAWSVPHWAGIVVDVPVADDRGRR